jgi:hypothetical protein
MTADYKVADDKWRTLWPEFVTFWNAGGWVFEVQDQNGEWQDYQVERSDD